MIMKKSYLFPTALALLLLASCSSDEFVGENNPQGSNGSGGAISFTTGTPMMTRATGSEAAGLLNNNFVVYGYKTVSGSPQVVFDNYQVNWATNTAGKSETNSADWEYVSSGIKNLPFGTTTASGEALNNNGVSTNASSSSTNVEQSIKYWDYSASAYDFFAYSLGDGNSSTWAKASAMNKTGYGDGSSHPGYTLEGTAAQLGTCYISNKKNVVPSSSSATEVDLEFRSFLSQIELKFYETIPGYSVKSLSFYPAANDAAAAIPYLFAGSEVLPTGGKYTVTFDNNGNAQLTFDTGASSKTFASNIAFNETLTNYAHRDYREADVANTYIGRASNAATSTDLISVLPNPQNSNALNLKIDFTLVSRDGTGEEINLTGATAVVPAIYAKWLPNYKYTYIFKISDNTNGSTGQNITGLYPITLDAVVTDAVDGTQTTITTVATPSVTTYQKGHVATTNEYKLPTSSTEDKDDIYVQVMNDGTLVNNLNHQSGEPLADDYSFFYKLNADKTEAEVMDALNIRESVSGTTITGRNGLELTPATIDNTITAIPGEDGHDIEVNAGEAAKVTPDVASSYAYVYLVSAGTPSSVYTAQELISAPTDWSESDNIYYSNPNGSDQINSTFADQHAFVLTAEPTGWNASDNVYYSDDGCTTPINSTFASQHAFVLTAEPADWSESGVWYKDTGCTTPVDDYSDGTYYKKVNCYKKVTCYKKVICYKQYTDLNNTYAVKVIKVVE